MLVQNEINDDIKFLAKSEIRLKILSELNERPNDIRGLVKKTKITYSSVSSNVNKLEANNYIKKVEKKYNRWLNAVNATLKLETNNEEYKPEEDTHITEQNFKKDITVIKEWVGDAEVATNVRPSNITINLEHNQFFGDQFERTRAVSDDGKYLVTTFKIIPPKIVEEQEEVLEETNAPVTKSQDKPRSLAKRFKNWVEKTFK